MKDPNENKARVTRPYRLKIRGLWATTFVTEQGARDCLAKLPYIVRAGDPWRIEKREYRPHRIVLIEAGTFDENGKPVASVAP